MRGGVLRRWRWGAGAALLALLVWAVTASGPPRIWIAEPDVDAHGFETWPKMTDEGLHVVGGLGDEVVVEFVPTWRRLLTRIDARLRGSPSAADGRTMACVATGSVRLAGGVRLREFEAQEYPDPLLTARATRRALERCVAALERRIQQNGCVMHPGSQVILGGGPGTPTPPRRGIYTFANLEFPEGCDAVVIEVEADTRRVVVSRGYRRGEVSDHAVLVTAKGEFPARVVEREGRWLTLETEVETAATGVDPGDGVRFE